MKTSVSFPAQSIFRNILMIGYAPSIHPPDSCPGYAMSLLDQLFVFHPDPWQDRDWKQVSGLPLEDIWFPSADGTKLFGWYVETAADRPVLLWCHGNAGNVIHRLENLRALYAYGFSVFIFDYRGYGRSQGRPSEKGLYEDAIGAYDYLTRVRMLRWERLVIFGRSLGAAVAGELAARKPAAGLILESAFPSVEAVGKFLYAGLPVHWLIGAEFRLIDRLPHLSLPKLVIHGDQDDVIPLELGRQVFEAAKPPKSFTVIPGANHNDTYHVGGASYFTTLSEFAMRAIRS
ncbi:alpha/beta hydrolase [Nitrospira sp. KM1]|uniref:alpha/beta hydrolase n=1 Tax=Nitrospira sp. KM1 TaxID=1936990 RepID=UPI0013A73EA7|nr:alpha/beta hydrolase [Nitrospira sp. KM1]BCA55068.1 alpha/beta hydrolase [Nitrospira sp. KM1]